MRAARSFPLRRIRPQALAIHRVARRSTRRWKSFAALRARIATTIVAPEQKLPTGKKLAAAIPGRPQQLNSFPANLVLSPDGKYAVALNGGYGTAESGYQAIARGARSRIENDRGFSGRSARPRRSSILLSWPCVQLRWPASLRVSRLADRPDRHGKSQPRKWDRCLFLQCRSHRPGKIPQIAARSCRRPENRRAAEQQTQIGSGNSLPRRNCDREAARGRSTSDCREFIRRSDLCSMPRPAKSCIGSISAPSAWCPDRILMRWRSRAMPPTPT